MLLRENSQSLSLSSCVLTCDLEMHGTVHGQGQRQEVERVKASANVAAGLTLHLRLELTVEEIYHDGTVSAQVVLPCL